MAQSSSNTLSYHQIFMKLRSFYVKEARNEFKSNQERIQEYNSILSEIYENISAPMSKYTPVIKGEPPYSEKMNTFSQNLEEDINAIMPQVDYLSAKLVSSFNLFFEEVENEKKYVERISSKSKILQMYSLSEAEDIIYVGDSFDNLDKVDITKIKKGFIPIISSGSANFPVSTVTSWQPTSVSISSGNGFIGNNHQVIKSVNSEGVEFYKYIFEDSPSLNYIRSAVDSSPLTYFEYEALNVDKESLYSVGNLPSEKEFCFVADGEFDSTLPEGSLVNWSNHDIGSPLQMNLLMETSSAQKANSVDIVPYFSSMRLVKVSSIKVFSADGSFEEILDDNIYIGSSLLPLTSSAPKNYFYNKASIKFSERLVSKIEIAFEQEEFQQVEIQHVYWRPNYSDADSSNSPFVGLNRFSPDQLRGYSSVEYDVRSLLPVLSDTLEYKTASGAYKNVPVTLSQNGGVESFKVITFIDSNTGTTYYFAGFSESNEITLGGTPPGFIYSSDFIYDNVFKQTVRFSSEEDANSSKSILELVIQNHASDQGDGTYVYNPGNTFPEVRIDPESISVIDYSHSLSVSSETYNVPIALEKEVLPAKRMTLGIRDISVNYETYSNNIEIVSTVYDFDVALDSIMLSVDTNVGNEYLNKVDANYYISVEDGKWISISPVQLDHKGIPEVICFNKNVADSFKLPGVAYLNYPEVPKTVKQVRVKMEVSKNRNDNVTPNINSYQLIAKVKR